MRRRSSLRASQPLCGRRLQFAASAFASSLRRFIRRLLWRRHGCRLFFAPPWPRLQFALTRPLPPLRSAAGAASSSRRRDCCLLTAAASPASRRHIPAAAATSSLRRLARLVEPPLLVGIAAPPRAAAASSCFRAASYSRRSALPLAAAARLIPLLAQRRTSFPSSQQRRASSSLQSRPLAAAALLAAARRWSACAALVCRSWQAQHRRCAAIHVQARLCSLPPCACAGAGHRADDRWPPNRQALPPPEPTVQASPLSVAARLHLVKCKLVFLGPASTRRHRQALCSQPVPARPLCRLPPVECPVRS